MSVVLLLNQDLTRHREFSKKTPSWRNKCDQVLLWQPTLGLIAAVHNAGAKVAPSQKHICQQRASNLRCCNLVFGRVAGVF